MNSYNTNEHCIYCKSDTKIYLKSKSVTKLNEIDFSATQENSILNLNKKNLPKPNLFVCNKCSIIFSEFHNIKFENKYGEVVDNVYINQIKYKKLCSKNRITKMKDELSIDKDILEIGSYYGAFGSEVLNYVNSYTGIEVSKHAANFSKEKYKLQIYNTSVEDHFKISPNYDLIVMFDVIEHLDDPMHILKICNSKLKKDGILIFSTMNMDSFAAKILGKHYPLIMLMHKFYFTNNSLKKILEKNNFNLYKIKYDARILSMEYVLSRYCIRIPKINFIFKFLLRFNFIKKIATKINLFDLNIYFAKKSE